MTTSRRLTCDLRHLAIQAAFVGLGCVSCGGASLPTPTFHIPEDHLGLYPGEEMTFDVSLANFLVGRGRFAVGAVHKRDVQVGPQPLPVASAQTVAPAPVQVTAPGWEAAANKGYFETRFRGAVLQWNLPPHLEASTPSPPTTTSAAASSVRQVTAVVVESRVESAGAAALVRTVKDAATTIIDLDARLPLAYSAVVKYGKQAFTAEALFTGSRVHINWLNLETNRKQVVRFDFGGEAPLDTTTAMARLRVWRGEPGQTRNVWVVGGRRMWKTVVTWQGSEAIPTKFGNRLATRIEGLSFRAKANLQLESDKPLRAFTVWLSDDADRVPLRVSAHTELGDVLIELTHYARPST